MQIEEIKNADNEGITRKEFKYINSDELAGSEVIKFYLGEIDNSAEDIGNRGLNFFEMLCGTKRVAWFFSSGANIKNRLTNGADNVRLTFLRALGDMIRLEPHGSSWRTELIKSVKETITGIAISERNVDLCRQALKIAELAADVISLTDLGFQVLEKPMSDNDFDHLLSELKSLLIRSEEAKTKKVLIREHLDRISIKGDILKRRVSKVLEGAPP